MMFWEYWRLVFFKIFDERIDMNWQERFD